ncbi:MAG: Type II/IV secretion system ATPase TadZ/CpaE, associated with Flp pilus assembly [uncultured Acidimicrobiales bacterium]|uniref:Type II/IV secretion system ATPase TadZ/CpaE, associated with Flp pilus assembly n=1 Tax=uncultured Acidimicrobiales bacterium TaxID=310071 RepID=A0A6J4H5T4_9ACTN|nr:MAG: Type II/IV secretion system ATPase TadZ/CpaE, associated with Flp pilus assembly [uncultured Acidimicrobiales bacterium]
MHTQKLLVLDDTKDLSLQVERVTASLRPSPSVVWCDSFDSVEGVIADAGPFDAVVVGPIVLKVNGFQRLRELRAVAPRTQLLLVLNHWRSSDMRETVRAGALDILRLPVTDETLLEAVEQALETGATLASIHAERGQADAAKSGPGTVIAVVSASGGSGKTFLATNLAYHLQTSSDRQICLIDLDLQFGELSTALRLKPRHTIYDLLNTEDESDDLGARLEQHLERHESGIRVLAAPDDPEHADSIEAVDVARIIEAARSRFDYVVVDTPTALSEAVLVALEQADQIFVLATLDLPSVRNLGIMMTTLKKLKVPVERVSLLLNKVEPDVGIDVARVEQYFPQGFSMVIPYGREVNRSLNMGQPVLAYAPRGEVSKALATGLVATLVGHAGADAGADAPERRRRRPWSNRKSA